MTTTVNIRLKMRGRLAADWTSGNEVLLAREMGIETDTRRFKFGDGTTAWNSLAYASGATLGSGVETFLATPSSANLRAAVTDETGTGALVFAESPTLVTPALGTPSSLNLSNATSLPVAGITASTSTALGVGSVELGHASDTTLARSSAGNVTIEGNLIYRAGGTDVPVTDGGTGASSASAAATNLGLGTGSNVTFANLDIATGGRIVTPSIRIEGTAPFSNVKDTDSLAATSTGHFGGQDSGGTQTFRFGRPFGDGNLWIENAGGTIYIARAIGGTVAVTISATGTDVAGEMRCDTLRIDATPTAAVVAQSHHVPIVLNGTTYKLLLAS